MKHLKRGGKIVINYIRNQRVIKRWIKYLELILKKQKLGLYEEIENYETLNRLIEVIEEYDDIIFWEE